MSRMIWLIVEADKDGLIFQAIIQKIQPEIRVKYRKPIGAKGGISRLANQLHELIEDALHQKPLPDCIVVLHDVDELSQPDRTDYKRIEEDCKRYPETVIHILARDEIESWLLADSEMCKWLKQKPKNHDHRPNPKEELIRWLKRENKPTYTDANMAKILLYIDGTGHKHSHSMEDAIATLRKSGCL